MSRKPSIVLEKIGLTKTTLEPFWNGNGVSDEVALRSFDSIPKKPADRATNGPNGVGKGNNEIDSSKRHHERGLKCINGVVID